MGSYLNPGNEKFAQCINSEIYIDKSGLIRYCSRVMNSLQKYISMSRPRRFGKSVTADMLTAYYSRGCDSAELFAGLEISGDVHYTENMNRYNVLFRATYKCTVASVRQIMSSLLTVSGIRRTLSCRDIKIGGLLLI